MVLIVYGDYQHYFMQHISRFLFLIFLIVVSPSVYSHTINHAEMPLPQWQLQNGQQLEAALLMEKNGYLHFQKADGQIVQYPLSAFINKHQAILDNRLHTIAIVNQSISSRALHKQNFIFPTFRYVLLLIILLGVMLWAWNQKGKNKTLAFGFSGVAVLAMVFSFTTRGPHKMRTTTNPLTVDSAFVPFKPNVVTSWDNNYFYVESKGIPTTHKMMIGISNHGWQQQVPIPQCYILPNAWPIPLNPSMAANPIPVDSIHFTRGAIAIAVNGVPIFNPHTNTGVDAMADGQLDNYGGHCGRADDYHYHTAPLHLYGSTAPSQPIAYALDGYAVYGNQEPDGSAMQNLDINHGHFGTNGIYHYHGTTSYPYMIARMVGNVTEDATHQLIPQAAAQPIRPSLTPLNGALITDCVPNGNNGYTLTYTLNNQTYQVQYSWSANGIYTFNFIGPNGTTTNNYNGFTPCVLPNAINDIQNNNKTFAVYPNPNQGIINIQWLEESSLSNIQDMRLLSSHGLVVWSHNGFANTIQCNGLSSGIYFLVVKTKNKLYTQKVLMQ